MIDLARRTVLGLARGAVCDARSAEERVVNEVEWIERQPEPPVVCGIALDEMARVEECWLAAAENLLRLLFWGRG